MLRSRSIPAVLALAAAACGGGESGADGAIGDAPVEDAGADGAPDGPIVDADPTPDAMPRGVVRVQTYLQDGSGRVAAGVTVLFAEPDGRIAAQVVADSIGQASAEIDSGGSITAIWPEGTGAQIVTMYGVDAGDEIVFGLPGSGSTVPVAPATVSFTPASEHAHRLYATCGEVTGAPRAQSLTVPMRRGCDRPPRDLLLVALDGANNPVQFLPLPDQGSDPITVPEPAPWQTVEPTTVSLAAVPSDVGRVTVTRVLRSGLRSLFSSSSGALSATGGSFGVPIPNALLGGDDMVVVTTLAQEAGAHVQVVADLRAVSRSYDLDVGAAVMPWVSAPRFDVASRELRWTQTGSGGYDALVLDARYTRDARAFTWRVYAPVSTGSLVLPDLPSEVGDVEPRAGDAGELTSVVLLQLGDETYRTLRPHIDIDRVGLLGVSPVLVESRIAVSRTSCGPACPALQAE